MGAPADQGKNANPSHQTCTLLGMSPYKEMSYMKQYRRSIYAQRI